MIKDISAYILISIFTYGYSLHAQEVSTNYNVILDSAQTALNNGKYLKSEKLATIITDLSDEKQNLLLKAHAFRILAQILALQSRMSERIDDLYDSYRYFKLAGDLKEEGESLRLIGHYFVQSGLYIEAEKYLSQAIHFAHTYNDTVSIINTLSNQAQLMYGLNNMDSAIVLYNEAISLATIIKYRKGLYENYNRAAYSYWKKEQPGNMLYSMRNVVKYKSNNSDTLGIMYSDLGLAYMQFGGLDSADYYLQLGMKLISNGQNGLQKMTISGYLSELKEHQGLFEEAYLYSKQYAELYRLLNENKRKKEEQYVKDKYENIISETEQREASEIKKMLLIVVLITSFFVVLFIVLTIKLIQLYNANNLQKEKLNKTIIQFKKSEELYRQLFNSSLIFSMTHDFEGVISSVNDEMIKLFKKDENDIVGTSIRQYLHPNYQELFDDYLIEIRTEKHVSGQMAVIDGEGNDRILKYQNRVVDDGNGSSFVIVSCYDQTEFFKTKKQSDVIIRRTKVIMDNSPDLYALMDIEGSIKYMNHSDYYASNGSKKENIFELVSGNQAERVRNNLSKVFENKGSVQFEERYNNRHILAKFIPVFEDDNVKEVLATFTDITQPKERKARIKQLSTIIQKSNVGVLITDINERVIWVNEGFTKITGFQRNYVLDKIPGEILKSPNSEKNTVEYMSRCVGKRKPFTTEVLNYHPKGYEYWVKLVAEPIFDENQKFNGYFFIQTDITNEKRMLSEIIAAKEEAESSNKLKTIFLGSLSHEVRTPLQGILGFSEILESTVLDDLKRQEYLSLIKSRALDVQNIIEALLDLASLETGEIKASPKETDLNSFITPLFEKFEEEISRSYNSLTIVLENKLKGKSMVKIDPQHLLQVLNNLIYNAIKFSESGTIVIHCEHEMGTYLFRIKDQGIGIAPEKICSIFEPFRQAHEGISRAKGGIGLGLSICKKMVKLWGGDIHVETELGVGSTFSICIPDEVYKCEVS